MNSDEYEEIVNFIRKENYPEAAQVSRQKKWYYKRRLTPPYFIGESNKLKVSLI